MIAEEKMILKMKKRNPCIIVSLSILIIFLTTMVLWITYQVNADTQKLIRAANAQNQNTRTSQSNLYLITLKTSQKYTTVMFISAITGIMIVCLTMALTKNPLFKLIVSMWERLERLEQQIKSDHDIDSPKDTDQA